MKRPSTHLHNLLNPIQGHEVVGANPATVGQGRGTPWTDRQSLARLSHNKTHTPTLGQFEDINQPMKHVSGLGEEAGVAGGNPHMLEENMQLYREPSQDLNLIAMR